MADNTAQGPKTGPLPETDLEKAAQQARHREVFVQKLNAMVSFDGELEKVECTLAGFEGINIYYCVSNTVGLGELFEIGLPFGLSEDDFTYYFTLFVRKIEFPPTFKTRKGTFPTITAETRHLLTTLWDAGFHSLMLWMQRVGYPLALEQAASPQS